MQHCATLRQIITHYQNCNRSDCPICSPLKNRAAAPQQNKPSLSSASSGGSESNIVSSAPVGAGVSIASKDEMTRTYETLGIDPNDHLQRSSANFPLQTAASKSVVAATSLQETSSNSTTGHASAMYDASITSKPMKDWHLTVVQDLRNHLIHKL